LHTNHSSGVVALDSYSKWHNALDKMRPLHHWSALRAPLLQQKRHANMQWCSAVLGSLKNTEWCRIQKFSLGEKERLSIIFHCWIPEKDVQLGMRTGEGQAMSHG